MLADIYVLRRRTDFGEWLALRLDCGRRLFLSDGYMEMANCRRW